MMMVSHVAEDPGDLPFMYAVMILHEVQEPITNTAITGILTAAGMELTTEDDTYIKWLTHKLESEDIDELMIPTTEPAYVHHPVKIVDDLLKPEADPYDEEEEIGDLWKNLFGPG